VRFEHGQVVYLQIPALDVATSATFYRAVFGWQVDPPQSGFEAPGMIGQWVTDRSAAADAGPLLWINVDAIDATLESVGSNGGDVLDPPSADGPRWLATIRDPGGNVVGLAQHGPREIA
jgi:predicted enzyme related to lactoylglutathione lyase